MASRNLPSTPRTRAGSGSLPGAEAQLKCQDVTLEGFTMKSIALALILLIPDRLPSLSVLVGFWIPPAVAGWLAAEFLQRSAMRYRAAVTYAALTTFVLGY